MSSETVKPTPASRAIPSRSAQVMSSSSSARVNRASRYVEPKMPMLLPNDQGGDDGDHDRVGQQGAEVGCRAA